MGLAAVPEPPQGRWVEDIRCQRAAHVGVQDLGAVGVTVTVRRRVDGGCYDELGTSKLFP